METREVILLVFDGLSDWEIGYVTTGIQVADLQRHPGAWRIRTVSAGGRPVTTMGGLRVLPEGALEETDPAASGMLVLPGGMVWERGGNEEALDLAARCLEAGVPVAGICGATYGLARTGLLDRRRHTSNAREYLASTGYRGGDLYEEAPAVTDGDVITASGVAPVDFALHIFRRLDLFAPPVAEAWFGLFKTGRPEFFAALQAAVAEGQAPTP